MAVKWKRQFDGTGTARVEKVALDSRGNAVVVGTFTESIEIDGKTLTSAGQSDVFLTKLDGDGDLVWCQRFGSSGDDRSRGLAVSGNDDITITGYFSQTIDLGGGELTGNADTSVFVARFDSDGAPSWARAFGDAAFNSGKDVASDLAGNVYVVGDFVDTIDFGGGQLTSAGSSDAFFAKFDPDGNHVSSRAFGDPGQQEASAVTVTPEGNVILLGAFQGQTDFGGGPLTGGTDANLALFVAKFDDRMNHIWSTNALSNESHSAVATGSPHDHTSAASHSVISAADQGTMLVGAGRVGVFQGNDFGVLNPPNSLLQTFGRYGDTLLEEPLGVGQTQGEGALALEDSGRVLVTGDFVDTLKFGDGKTLASAGGRDLLLAEFDARGTHLRSTSFGDARHSEIGWSIAVAGGVAVVGGWLRPNDVDGVDAALVVAFRP